MKKPEYDSNAVCPVCNADAVGLDSNKVTECNVVWCERGHVTVKDSNGHYKMVFWHQ